MDIKLPKRRGRPPKFTQQELLDKNRDQQVIEQQKREETQNAFMNTKLSKSKRKAITKQEQTIKEEEEQSVNHSNHTLYQQMYQFYTRQRFSLKLKHYLTKVPEVSKSIQTLIFKLKAFQLQRNQLSGQSVDLIGEPGILISEQCRWVARTLLFTEIEIICWVKYLQRFNFADQKLIENNATSAQLDVNYFPQNQTHKPPDESEVQHWKKALDLRENALITYALETILFVGLAVKNMLTIAEEKECIWQHLTKTMKDDQNGLPFMYRFQCWNTIHMEKFREASCEDLVNHNISKELDQGFEPMFQIGEQVNIDQPQIVKQQKQFNSKYKEAESNADLEELVDYIVSSNKSKKSNYPQKRMRSDTELSESLFQQDREKPTITQSQQQQTVKSLELNINIPSEINKSKQNPDKQFITGPASFYNLLNPYPGAVSKQRSNQIDDALNYKLSNEKQHSIIQEQQYCMNNISDNSGDSLILPVNQKQKNPELKKYASISPPVGQINIQEQNPFSTSPQEANQQPFGVNQQRVINIQNLNFYNTPIGGEFNFLQQLHSSDQQVQDIKKQLLHQLFETQNQDETPVNRLYTPNNQPGVQNIQNNFERQHEQNKSFNNEKKK